MSTEGSGIKYGPVPTMQADATLAQANPVSGTKYTVLNTTRNVRIIDVGVKVTWTVQPSPLECHILIDGIQFTFAKSDPVTATWYYPQHKPNNVPTAQVMNVDDYASGAAFFLEGKSIKVEVETTGGTVQNLDARVQYAKW